MGDRGLVEINGVALYTHWNAIELIDDVKRAFKRFGEIDDLHYLATIILEEMITHRYHHVAGIGIGRDEIDYGCWRIIRIEEETISISDLNFKSDFKTFMNTDFKKLQKEKKYEF